MTWLTDNQPTLVSEFSFDYIRGYAAVEIVEKDQWWNFIVKNFNYTGKRRIMAVSDFLAHDGADYVFIRMQDLRPKFIDDFTNLLDRTNRFIDETTMNLYPIEEVDHDFINFHTFYHLRTDGRDVVKDTVFFVRSTINGERHTICDEISSGEDLVHVFEAIEPNVRYWREAYVYLDDEHTLTFRFHDDSNRQFVFEVKPFYAAINAEWLDEYADDNYGPSLFGIIMDTFADIVGDEREIWLPLTAVPPTVLKNALTFERYVDYRDATEANLNDPSDETLMDRDIVRTFEQLLDMVEKWCHCTIDNSESSSIGDDPSDVDTLFRQFIKMMIGANNAFNDISGKW